MEIFRGLDQVPKHFGPTVVSIGNFDGVHLGHQLILRQLRASAAARSARSVAVTFDPHPLRFLRPETCPRLITPLETKLELLERAASMGCWCSHLPRICLAWVRRHSSPRL